MQLDSPRSEEIPDLNEDSISDEENNRSSWIREKNGNQLICSSINHIINQ